MEGIRGSFELLHEHFLRVHASTFSHFLSSLALPNIVRNLRVNSGDVATAITLQDVAGSKNSVISAAEVA
jgi:hypothetical protein